MKASKPLGLAAVLTLLAAAWGGLVRLGWDLPPLISSLIPLHGPLMVSGFLGTLISLERGVALGNRWAYGPPLLSSLGSVLLVFQSSPALGIGLITLASASFLGVSLYLVFSHRSLYTATMAAGAFSWTAGNLLWAAGTPLNETVFWWMGLPLLTITGERLELGRVLRPGRLSGFSFAGLALLCLIGMLLAGAAFPSGHPLLGLGLLGMMIWLLVNDLSRHTIRGTGLTRYIAACLLGGYLWLGTSGLLLLISGPPLVGLRYDAVLHALFLGFTFSLIFGHAPLIIPALLGRPFPYHKGLYLPLGGLHLSLVLRVFGDLSTQALPRQWGGMLNGFAILLFLGLSLLTLVKSPPEEQAALQR